MKIEALKALQMQIGLVLLLIGGLHLGKSRDLEALKVLQMQIGQNLLLMGGLHQDIVYLGNLVTWSSKK